MIVQLRRAAPVGAMISFGILSVDFVVSTTQKMEGEIESRAKEKFKVSCPKKTSLCWPKRQPVLSGLVSGFAILCVIAMIGIVESEELSVADHHIYPVFDPIKTMFDLCEKGDLSV